jgi:hypothetical protein
MTNTIFNIISGITALGYTSIYLTALSSFPVLAQMVMSILSFGTLFAVYRGSFYKFSSQNLEGGKKRPGFLSLLFFSTLGVVVAWSMYFEFFGVILAGLPASFAFVCLAHVISVIAATGSASLMIANGLELVDEDNEDMPFWKLLMVIAFYSCVVLSALHPFGQLFQLKIPESVVMYLLPTLTTSLVYFTHHEFLVETCKEFVRLCQNPILAITLFIARIIDRALKLIVSSFHFVAESFLPAAGVIRSNQTIMGIAPKFQALGLVMTLTLAEVMQDYESIFNDSRQKYLDKVQGQQWFLSALYVAAAVSCFYYSWQVILPITFAARYLLSWPLFKGVYQTDKIFFKFIISNIKSLLTLKNMAVPLVCAVAGYASAIEMQLLLPLSTVLLMVFALSGMWVETKVYNDAIDSFSENHYVSSDQIAVNDSKTLKNMNGLYKDSSDEMSLVGIVKHLFAA